jgi:hypothetical protein
MFRDEGEGRAIGRKWTSEKGMNRLTAYAIWVCLFIGSSFVG